MQRPSEREPKIGYLVSTWPRLSQTFVLNEILALERCGVSLRIFSTKAPRAEPVNVKVARVRAPVTYLNFRRHGWTVLRAYLRIARELPGRYLPNMVRELHYGRRSTMEYNVTDGYVSD